MARTTRRAANRIVRSDASQQDGRPVAAGTPGGTTGQVLAKTSVADFDAAWVTLSYVAPSRQIISGAGLTGGGDLSADRTLAVGAGTGITVNADDVALDTASTRNVDHAAVSVIAGAGLTGGGTIAADRTLNVGAGTGITVNADDVALDTASSRNVDHAGVSVIAGAGLTGGGTIAADRTLNIGAGVGITVNADDIAVNYGTTGITACVGNDARLSDARTPTAHAASHAAAGSDPLTLSESQITNLGTDLAAKALKTTTVSAGAGLTGGGDLSANRTITANVGSAAGTLCAGDDARLSDARTPTAHNVLSVSHGDTLAAAVVRGSIIVGNATPKWSALAVGAAGTVLIGGTDPAWSAAPTVTSITTGVVSSPAATNLSFRINNVEKMLIDTGGSWQVTAVTSHAIGTSADARALLTVGGAWTGASDTIGFLFKPTLQGVAGRSIATQWLVPTEYKEAASGNHPLIAVLQVDPPATYTADAATVSDTATVYISGPMAATVTGGNWALWVDNGITRLDGQIQGGAGSAAAPSYSCSGDVNTGIYFDNADGLYFATNGTVRVQITSVGRTQHSSGDAAAPGISFISATGDGLYSISSGTLGLAAGGALRVQIDSTGLTMTANLNIKLQGTGVLDFAAVATGAKSATLGANGPMVTTTPNTWAKANVAGAGTYYIPLWK